MAHDSSHLITLGQYESLAAQVKAQIESAIAALPVEKFLDQTKTTFVSSFSFSTTTYPGATNPNLDGKPVMVLAVKGNDGSTSYSFLNMATLVDTYTSGNTKTLTISGRTITVKVSAVANNAITIQSDGLHVNMSGKADKVSGATNGNFAGLDANGNITDSGIAKSTVTGKATKVSSATANNLAMLTSGGDLADSGIAKGTVATKTEVSAKADKVSSATANNLAALNSSGNPVDAGIAKGNVLQKANVATDAEVTEVLTEIFGS